jgi:hypothetical protein
VTDSDGLNKGEYQIESGIHGGGNYKVRILSASSFENDVIVVEQNGTNYLYAYIAETEPKFIPAYEDTAVFQDHNIEDSDIKKAYWIKDALQEGYDYITLPGIYLAEWEPDWDITSHHINGRIFINGVDVDNNSDVVLHEMGHAVMDYKYVITCPGLLWT